MEIGDECATSDGQKIVVIKDGPYLVQGEVPLVYKEQIVSEYGEPLTWKKGEAIGAEETHALCRCGHSSNKPLCDGRHVIIGFDSTESADPWLTTERQVIEGGTNIIVKHDYSLCMKSGFCGNRGINVLQMIRNTADTSVRSQVIAMIERCPSGSYTYSLKDGTLGIEPDLPKQVAVVTGITSDGPIAGPLWVKGNIPIEQADEQPFETHNRVTICCCGLSNSKRYAMGCTEWLA